MEPLAAFHRSFASGARAGCGARAARWALAPAGWLYGAVSYVRAALYRQGVLSSYRPGVPVISVGNIAVGGTGKTPTVDYIVKLLLAEGKRVAVVSRGYGARVRGVGIVSAGEGPLLAPADCGDEPYLLAWRNPEALVLVAPRRREGVRVAEDLGAEVVVLDDGFQHLPVRRDLDIVLLDARRPLGNGHVLPAGLLREFPRALGRAGLFLMTRCPDPVGADPPGLRAPVLHSRHVLADQAFSPDGGETRLAALAGKKGIAFAGIAEPEGFFSDLERKGLHLTARLSFVDHVAYGTDEIKRLFEAAKSGDYLITTEKDGVKLRGGSFPVPCYQVPLVMQVLEADAFRRRILDVIPGGAPS